RHALMDYGIQAAAPDTPPAPLNQHDTLSLTCAMSHTHWCGRTHAPKGCPADSALWFRQVLDRRRRPLLEKSARQRSLLPRPHWSQASSGVCAVLSVLRSVRAFHTPIALRWNLLGSRRLRKVAAAFNT